MRRSERHANPLLAPKVRGDVPSAPVDGRSSATHKPLLLDLFCGAGGCTKGYQQAGFYVVGVDIRPQSRYCGDEFVQRDALELLRSAIDGAYRWAPDWLDQFDAIHASPPCQHYSSITKVSGRSEDHPDLIGPTRELLVIAGLPYVIENVERARTWLRDPTVICGAACGLSIDDGGRRYRLKRHRLFETNWPLMAPRCACHPSGEVLGVYGGGTRQDTRKRKNLTGGNTNKANRRQAQALMEMPWATREEMNLAVPPAYTELIGHQLMQHIRATRREAVSPGNEERSVR